MTARRHHYVPQCYLKGFAADRDKAQLHVVDVRRLAAFRTSTKNVAQERDFHSLADTNVDADALEAAFSGFESEASLALERCIAAECFFSGEDRGYILNLIALMAVKNPRIRANADRFRKRVMKAAMDLALSSPEIWNSQIRKAKEAGFIKPNADTDYERMRAAMRADAYEIVISPADHLITEMDVFDSVLPLFFQRAWTVLRAPREAVGFITSDQPVCLIWSGPPVPGLLRQPPGFGRPGTLVLFALAPSLALVGAFEGEDKVIDATESQIADFNFAMVQNARRQIYARHSDFLYRFEHGASPRAGHLLDDLEQRRALPAPSRTRTDFKELCRF
ncbi:DUF4238 domain-containing protein [Phenylobacterium sp.]|uniref:DUF4238 domain-containing protein n=1 Tax=Phenylobacterium sp. TaxID=1871053 RepID=UPI0025FEED81|nr:DUF4238 domain-containing protein [Phenylobacterium sp.]